MSEVATNTLVEPLRWVICYREISLARFDVALVNILLVLLIVEVRLEVANCVIRTRVVQFPRAV